MRFRTSCPNLALKVVSLRKVEVKPFYLSGAAIVFSNSIRSPLLFIE